MKKDHHSDADCLRDATPEERARYDDPENVWECMVCGVQHWDPCGACGKRGYHDEGCPESDETHERAVAEGRAEWVRW